MFDNNIKVHFAGSDGNEISHSALQGAGVRYRLYSCYQFIDKKTPNSDFTLPDKSVIKTQDNEMRHVIQDSGLFTLMFGAGKDRVIDMQYLIDWQDKLIKFVTQNNLKCTCVELDCQKVLGVEESWYLRQRMKDKLPNNQINVFHYEDGKKGLDRLIEFSDYIAISVPELRIVKPRRYKQYAVQLAEYCKRKKPKIDIHMLGCTEYSMLEGLRFCTSADSTSWLSGVKYGYFNDGIKKAHISQFKEEILKERKEKISQIIKDRGIELKPKTLEYTTQASLCATIAKKRYEEVAGNQD